MAPISSVKGDAFFLSGVAGQIFALYYPPIDPPAQRLDVLLIPPFAEEMNRSRRMFALLARQLAQAGMGVLSVDLFGTGDSEGDFSDARWDVWLSDVQRAVAFLREQGAGRIAPLGLRAGALLLLDAQCREPKNFSAMILWQPMLNGALLMNQFLRLKVAADRLDNHPIQTTTTMLRSMLKEGQIIEIAGYPLHPLLFDAIGALEFDTQPGSPTAPIHWLDLTPQEPASATPVTARILDNWRAAGANVTLHLLQGESFWDAQETTVVPALCERTLTVLKAL